MFGLLNTVHSFFFDTSLKITAEYEQDTRTFHLRFSGKDAAFHREYITQIIKVFIDFSAQEEPEEEDEEMVENAAWIKKIQKMEREITSKMTNEFRRWRKPEDLENRNPEWQAFLDEIGEKQSTYPLHDVADVQRSVFDLIKKKQMTYKEEQVSLTANEKLERKLDIFAETYLASLSEDELLPQCLQFILNDSVIQNHRERVLLDQALLHPYLRRRHTPEEIFKWVHAWENNEENKKSTPKELVEKIRKMIPSACYCEADAWPSEMENEDFYIESEATSQKQRLIIKSQCEYKDSDGKSTILIISLTEMESSDDISVDQTSASIKCFNTLLKNRDELLWYLMVFNLRRPFVQVFENFQSRKESRERLIDKHVPQLTTDADLLKKFQESGWDRLGRGGSEGDVGCVDKEEVTSQSTAYSIECQPTRIIDSKNSVSYQFDTSEKSLHFLDLLWGLHFCDLEAKEEIKDKINGVSDFWNELHL
ncbi:MAG: hypothetical protein ABIH77_05265 [Pseudomonadota bacterium]